MNSGRIPPLLLNPESEKVTVTCSYCASAFEEIVSRVIYEPKVCCPRCRHVIKVDLLQLNLMLEGARKHAGNLFKRLVQRSGGRRPA